MIKDSLEKHRERETSLDMTLKLLSNIHLSKCCWPLLPLSPSLSLSPSHTPTHPPLSLSPTHTHTHTLSLSLSLSLPHAHTHTHTQSTSNLLWLRPVSSNCQH